MGGGVARVGGVWEDAVQVADEEAELVVEMKSTSSDPGAYPAAENGLLGFLNAAMSWRISPRFVNVGQFHEGFAVAAVHPGQFGLINSAGEFVSRNDYRDARHMAEGRAAVQTSEGWGFLERSGQIAIRPSHAEVHSFKDGMAVVSSIHHHSAAAWLNEDAYGYILPNGEPAVASRFQRAGGFNEGYAPVQRSGKWGWINRQGEWVIPNLYDAVTGFNGGTAYARIGHRRMLINASGDVLEESSIEEVDLWWAPMPLRDGLRTVKRGDLYGYADVNNVLRIPATFGTAQSFTNGRAVVRSRRRWALIDLAGEFVVPPVYNWLLPIGDLFYFVHDRENGYLDSGGHRLWSAPLGYDVVYRMQEFSRE